MIEHNIIAAKNCAYIAIKQAPDLESFIHASRIFVADPEYTPRLNRICDFSQADLNHITAADFKEYRAFAIEHIAIEPETRIALVAPSAEKRGIFEQFANKIDSGMIRIFSEPEDAVIWIHQGPFDDDPIIRRRCRHGLLP